MANVALTAALRANLLSLQGTASLLDQTQLRLATGKKVNSALDNPSSFFAAQALTNRAGDLSNLLDSMGQSIQVLKAADQGITSLTTLVKQAQAIAQSAQNSLSNSGFLRSGDFNAATVANMTSGTLGNSLTLQAGSSTAVTISLTGKSLQTVVNEINTYSGLSAQIVDASLNSAAGAGAKRLEIRATGGQTLTISGTAVTAAANLSTGVGGGAAGTRGDTGAALGALGITIASSQNTVDEVSLESQYSTVRSQIDALITDAGYQGTNLLNGDTMKVQFNEKNTSKLTVTGVTFNSTGLGISFTQANGGSQTFLNAANITTALNEITSALSTLRAQAQTFGNNLNIVQTRQDFTTNLINNLKAGSDALVLADKNEEGANLLALQTSQQLGIQALSLASQANQSVLRLFS